MIGNGIKTSDSDTKSIQRDTKSARSGTKIRKSEQLSNRDWAELMGTNRDTFKRHRGSVRRR